MMENFMEDYKYLQNREIEDIQTEEQKNGAFELDKEDEICLPFDMQDERNQFDFSDIIERRVSIDENSNLKRRFIYRKQDSSPAYEIQEQIEGDKYIVKGYKNGTCDYGMQGIKRIPYNLPDLMRAYKRLTFIVNGEDKADFLKELGFVATTAPFDSPHKWKEEFNNYLAVSGKVLIIQDNSEKGEIFSTNTFLTVRKMFHSNVSIMKISKLARKFNLELEDNTSLMDLKNILGDDSLLKEALSSIERSLIR